MKKWLSYIFPFSKKITSEVNGELELTLVNGKYLLDSLSTNYSYGSLQKILAFGLNQILPLPSEPALILGLGGGCVLETLRKSLHFKEKITAVDLDPKMIQLATNTFQVKQFQPIDLVELDAYLFLQKIGGTYGLIVVDLFIDNKVPSIFYSKEFAILIQQSMSREAKVLFNLGFDSSVNTEKIELISYFKRLPNITTNILTNVNGTNTLLLVQQKAYDKSPNQPTMARN